MENPKIINFFLREKVKSQKPKVKPLQKHCPAAMGTAFSTKFALDPKVKNSTL